MRHAEVDLARLLAMLLMAIYHVAYDLREYRGLDIAVTEGWWSVLQQTTLILFLLVSGVSAVLMRQKLLRRGRKNLLIPFWRRGAQVLIAALLVTAATYAFDPATFVRFGVLHCIAVTWLLLPCLLPLAEGNIALGFLLIGASRLTIVGSSFLLPLGFPPPNFATVDYVPLLPWMGVILIGAGIGHLLYSRGLRGAWQCPRPLAKLSLAGKYALPFYLLHQPVILAVLWIFRLVLPSP